MVPPPPPPPVTYPFSPCLKSPSCTASKLGVQYSVFLGRRLKYNKNRIHETVEKPKIPKPKKKTKKQNQKKNKTTKTKKTKKTKTKKKPKISKSPGKLFFFWFFGFGVLFFFFWFWYFWFFGFGILAFWFAFTVRGNNYTFFSVLMLIVLFRNSIQVVFLVLQNYLFRYYVSRAASV